MRQIGDFHLNNKDPLEVPGLFGLDPVVDLTAKQW